MASESSTPRPHPWLCVCGDAVCRDSVGPRWQLVPLCRGQDCPVPVRGLSSRPAPCMVHAPHVISANRWVAGPGVGAVQPSESGGPRASALPEACHRPRAGLKAVRHGRPPMCPCQRSCVRPSWAPGDGLWEPRAEVFLVIQSTFLVLRRSATTTPRQRKNKTVSVLEGQINLWATQARCDAECQRQPLSEVCGLVFPVTLREGCVAEWAHWHLMRQNR